MKNIKKLEKEIETREWSDWFQNLATVSRENQV